MRKQCSQQDELKHSKNVLLCVFANDYSVVQIILAIILLNVINASVKSHFRLNTFQNKNNNTKWRTTFLTRKIQFLYINWSVFMDIVTFN